MTGQTKEAVHDDTGGLRRLRWLIFLRLFIISFLLGIAAIIQTSGDEKISHQSLYLVFAIIGGTYFLSLIYTVFLRLRTPLSLHASLQAIIDVAIITALVYATGGVGSIYSILYPLVIIYAALFLGRRGTLLVASLSAICYGGLLDLEYFGYLHPMYGETYYYSFSAGYVFSRIFIHIVFFYIIAGLALFVAERERQAKSLLSEREDSFRRLDLLHRSIIESVNAGIVTVDRRNMVRSINPAAETILGRQRYQLLERNLEDVLPALSEIISDTDTTPAIREVTTGVVGGGETILGCSLSPLLDSAMSRIGTIIIFQDLTDMRALERQIEQNKKLAFLGEMSAVLAHELRNPLASIGGSIQLLQRDLSLDKGDRKLMEIIERGRSQLEMLAGDFLLLARSRSGVSFAHIHVEEVIDDVLESLRMAGDWNDDIRLVRKYYAGRAIRGIASEVHQTILNILTNALQAMPDGGELTVETRMTETRGQGERFLEIEVADSGGGIEKDVFERIREPFFTTRETGTGLGLVIVDRVMENHGGAFHIISEPGKGTRVVVGFPCEEEERDSEDL